MPAPGRCSSCCAMLHGAWTLSWGKPGCGWRCGAHPWQTTADAHAPRPPRPPCPPHPAAERRVRQAPRTCSSPGSRNSLGTRSVPCQASLQACTRTRGGSGSGAARSATGVPCSARACRAVCAPSLLLQDATCPAQPPRDAGLLAMLPAAWCGRARQPGQSPAQGGGGGSPAMRTQPCPPRPAPPRPAPPAPAWLPAGRSPLTSLGCT